MAHGIRRCALALLVACAAPPPSPAHLKEPHDTMPASAIEEKAKKYVGEMQDDAWKKLVSDVGRLERIDATRVETKDGKRIVFLTAKFARTRRELRVVFDDKDAVVGFWYAPVLSDLEKRARDVIEGAAANDFLRATASFGPIMKSAMPAEKFRELWSALENKMGKFQAIETIEAHPGGSAVAEQATSRFERESVILQVSFDEHDEVIGFHLLPVVAPWTPPPYAKSALYDERDVGIGSIPLPGTLTMPKTVLAAVVLVHGSGPSDQDETVESIKPFKDLAFGLASRGVAVLRYVKRTKHSPAGVVTQKEEVLDGARDAIALLAGTHGIDPKKIYVIGHSQGGNLAPRIAKDNPKLAGIVVLAGPTRSLQDLLIDQFRYLAPAKVPDAERFKQIVEDPKLAADQKVELPTGGSITGAYFLDVRDYKPEIVASKLPQRILVLQGERDYQVTMKDFEAWKAALGKQKNATLKSYPALNHLFVAGTGPSTPVEYRTGGHVDEHVIDDLAEWLTR
jgi:dienelactone hydrolase